MLANGMVYMTYPRNELYEFLFSSLETRGFMALFPVYDGCDDEGFVWQFLAGLAVGATCSEQQQTLVSALRENIVGVSQGSGDKGNVDLFLGALGVGLKSEDFVGL
jgi:hypothetical protein